MGFEPIDSNESYQVDQDGKVIDSILRDVTPEVDDDGPYINTPQGKKYIADLVADLHSKEAADAYLENFNAQQAPAEDTKAPAEEPELTKQDKVDACQQVFEDNPEATYSDVKDTLAEEGITVNDTHVSAGKEAAGLK